MGSGKGQGWGLSPLSPSMIETSSSAKTGKRPTVQSVRLMISYANLTGGVDRRTLPVTRGCRRPSLHPRPPTRRTDGPERRLEFVRQRLLAVFRRARRIDYVAHPADRRQAPCGWACRRLFWASWFFNNPSSPWLERRFGRPLSLAVDLCSDGSSRCWQR